MDRIGDKDMRIMVMKCTLENAFYKNKIGSKYTVEAVQGDNYIVKTKDAGGKFGMIKKTDAEVV